VFLNSVLQSQVETVADGAVGRSGLNNRYLGTVPKFHALGSIGNGVAQNPERILDYFSERQVLALPEHLLEARDIRDQRLGFGHTALHLFEFVRRRGQLVARCRCLGRVVASNPDGRVLLRGILHAALDQLEQNSAKALALRGRQVVGWGQRNDPPGSDPKLGRHGCAADRTANHGVVSRDLEVQHRPIAQTAAQFFEVAARGVLRVRGLNVLTVTRTEIGPAERIAIRSWDQRVPIKTRKRCDSRVPDIRIDEHDQYAAAFQQQAKLHLPLLQ